MNPPNQVPNQGHSNFNQVVCATCNQAASLDWKCVTPMCSNYGKTVTLPFPEKVPVPDQGRGEVSDAAIELLDSLIGYSAAEAGDQVNAAVPRPDWKLADALKVQSAITQATAALVKDLNVAISREHDCTEELVKREADLTALRAKLDECEAEKDAANDRIIGQEEQLKALTKTDCGFGGYVDSILKERDQLARWKTEQLTVESWWQKIDEAVRKHPDCRMGRIVADEALRLIQERDKFEAKLDLIAQFVASWRTEPGNTPGLVNGILDNLEMVLKAEKPKEPK